MKIFKSFWIELSAIVIVLLSFNGHAQNPDAPISGAQPKSFSTASDNLGFLQNSVNLFSGQVQFSMPIASIAGRNGLSYTLAFNYSSKVKLQAETWNREAPTGVLGLGWSLSSPKIIVDHKGSGTREDDTFYLVEGGSTNQLFYDGLDGTDWKFYLKAYQFWKIRYNPTNEIWTITKEDGTRYIYGDKNSTRKTVQYIAKWGNWIGNSSYNFVTQQQAFAWNLSEIDDLWNDKLTLEYLEDNEWVGGVQHTIASYLKEVKNVLGEKITLSYQNKLNNQLIPGTSNLGTEYVDPHGLYAASAYQDNFESKYLDVVSRYDLTGQKIGDTKLSYDFLGTGEMTKRLLNSITSYNAAGEASQPTIFNYEKNYDTQSITYNTGVLKDVTAPTKGSVSFTYQVKTLENTSRDYFVPKVDVTSGSNTGIYTEPQFWFGDDFVVMSRRLKPDPNASYAGSPHSTAPQPVILDVFTWDGGKWIQKHLGAYTSPGTLLGVTVSGSPFMKQDFQLVIGRDFFATLNRWGATDRYDLNLFKKNDNLPGDWTQQFVSCSRVNDPATSPYVNLGDDPKLLAGDNFVLVGAKTNKFFVFEWRGSEWSSWNADISGQYSYATASNYFIAHNNNGPSTDIIEFHVKNKSGLWQTFTVPSAASFNSTMDSHWYASNSFAVVVTGPNLLAPVNEYIYTWDENYGNFQRFDTGVSVDDASPVVINGPLVLITKPGHLTQAGNEVPDMGYAFRFDGQTWKSSGSLNYTGQGVGLRNLFSVGEDFIYRPHTETVPVNPTYNSYIRAFDAVTRTWKADVTIGPRTNNNYASIAGNNFLMCDAKLYLRNTDGTYGSPVSTELNPYLNDNNYTFMPISAGYDFLAYSFPLVSSGGNNFPGSTKVILLKNGQFQAPITRAATDSGFDPNDKYSELILDVVSSVVGFNLVPYAQVSGNTIVTFFVSPDEKFAQNSRSFRLYRKIGNKITGSLSDFVVTKITTNDGQSSTFTAYDYVTSTATTDASGMNLQFNEVRTIPGSTDPITNGAGGYTSTTIPSGYIKSFFLNGKAASEVSTDGAYPAVSGVFDDMQGYFKKLAGAPYKSLTFNSVNAVVTSSATDYQHSYWNQYTGNGSFYVRPSYVVTQQDGIKQRTQLIYNTSPTGQVETEISSRLDNAGAVIQQHKTEYVYYWQWYDINRLSNILSPVVYKRYSVDNVYTGIVATRWKNWGATYTPAPYDNYKWVGTTLNGWDYNPNSTPSAEWKFLGKINSRDAVSGAVTEQTGSDIQMVGSVILDEFSRLPLATIGNAALAEVAYCGFEDNSKGNFSWSDGTITSGDCKTGNKFFKLGTIGITKSGLSSSKKYTISFWAKSSGGSVIIDGVSGPINLGNLNQWTLFEYTVTGLTNYSIKRSGSIEVQVDDLRFLPSNGRMSTSTYHPVFGKTSETDANHKTVFYEFDSFGRAKFVRDQDKNIVRHVFSNIRY